MKSDTVYLIHILECIAKIEDYTKSGKIVFMQTTLIQDGVIRNMEVIGEAVKKLSPGFRESHAKVPWRQIAGIRDVLIHEYMGVDLDMIWEVIEKDLSVLKDSINRIM